MKRPLRTKLSPSNLSLIGVPRKFHKKTIKDFKDYNNDELKELKDFISNYINNLDVALEEVNGLCLYGSNGVGKTFIASLIVKEAYRHRYTAKRCTFVEYKDQYTRTWGSKDPTEKENLEDILHNKYKSVEFLVIEEVGKEVDSKVSAPILEDLLRYREDNSLVTIICMNLKPSQIKEKYGSSIASLLAGNMTPIRIVGDDIRPDIFNSED